MMRWAPLVFLLLACHRKATPIDAGAPEAPVAEAAPPSAPDAGHDAGAPREIPLLVEPTVDAGTPAAIDAGRDAGQAAAAPDEPAAAVDAGLPTAGFWSEWDGGELLDGGETDSLEVRVGRKVEIRLPQAVVMNVCDAPLVAIATAANSNALEITGLSPGSTHCGFWYAKSPAPHRYFRVAVTRE